MDAIKLLRLASEFAIGELYTALEGVTQGQAWAVLPKNGPDYLHSDASIHGITLHIAVGKRIYGSVGFRNTEVRWRDTADQVEAFEPNWAAALEYLAESHRYWLGTWAGLTADQLSEERPHFSGKTWTAWKIIQMIIHHDAYHAGQIAMLRYGCPESTEPPPSQAEDIRKYCVDLPSW